MTHRHPWNARRIAVATAVLLAGCGPRAVEEPHGGLPGEADAASSPVETPEAGPTEPVAETTTLEPEAESSCPSYSAADCPERCRREPGAMVVRVEFAGECAAESAFERPDGSGPSYEAGRYEGVIDAIQGCLRDRFRPPTDRGESTAEVDAAIDFRYRIAEGAGRASRFTVAEGELPDAETLFSCFEDRIRADYAGGALVHDPQFPPPQTLDCTMQLQARPGALVCR